MTNGKLELAEESGRSFLFAFLAGVCLIFGVGIILNVYVTPVPVVICNQSIITTGSNPGYPSGQCNGPRSVPKTHTIQFYIGTILALIGLCFGLLAIWIHSSGKRQDSSSRKKLPVEAGSKLSSADSVLGVLS